MNYDAHFYVISLFMSKLKNNSENIRFTVPNSDGFMKQTLQIYYKLKFNKLFQLKLLILQIGISNGGHDPFC